MKPKRIQQRSPSAGSVAKPKAGGKQPPAVPTVRRAAGRRRLRLPPKEFLDECVSYNPQTGCMTWRKRPEHHFVQPGKCQVWARNFAGRRAGTFNADKTGYRFSNLFVTYKGKRKAFVMARVVFALLEIPIPPHLEIDHIDRNGWNNRLSNLRLVTPTENMINRGRWINKDDKGLLFQWRKWWAYLYRDRQNILLGKFTTKEEAIAARKRAERDWERTRKKIKQP